MSLTEIQPINRNRSISYEHEIVENFFEKLSVDRVSESKLGDILTFLDSKAQSICVYTKSLDNVDRELIERLFAKRDKCRIYFLLEDISGIDDKFFGRTLIRTAESVHGSFIITRDNDTFNGIFYSTSFDSLEHSSHVLFNLDSKQCEEFFHYFCFRFWNEAVQEYIHSNPMEVTKNHQEDFLAPYNNGFDMRYCQGMLSSHGLSEYGSSYIFNENNLIFSNGFNTDNILALAKAYDIGFIDDDFAYKCVIRDSDSFFMLDSYMIMLNENQKEILQHHIQNMNNSLSHRFISQKCKGDLEGKTIVLWESILNHASNEIIITQVEEAKDRVSLTEFKHKDDFEGFEINFSDIKDSRFPYTCNINYEWVVIPFYTPDDCKLSLLYEEWEDTKKSLRVQIEGALKSIDKIENKQGELSFFRALVGDVLRGFKQMFLGKNVSFNELKNKLQEMIASLDRDTELLESLKNHSIYEAEILSIQSIENIYGDLQECIKKIAKHDRDVDQILDEAKAHNEWQENKNNLQDQIKKLEDSLRDSKNKQKDIYAKKELEERKENELKRKTEKEIKHHRTEIENLQKIVENLKEDISRNESRLSSLQKEYKEHYTTFRYKASNENSSLGEYLLAGNSIERPKIAIPKQNRPRSGILKDGENGYHIEIMYFEEADSAELEAQRLDAVISVRVKEKL